QCVWQAWAGPGRRSWIGVRTTARNGRLRWKVPIAVLGQPPGGPWSFTEVMVRPVRIPRLPRLPRAAAWTATPARAATAAAVVAVIATLTACSGPAPSNPAPAKAELAKVPPATYYLALGDSLAQGVQPNASGVSVMTRDGYPDRVYAVLHASRPGLKLVKLGCPGETTTSMINGGVCR